MTSLSGGGTLCSGLIDTNFEKCTKYVTYCDCINMQYWYKTRQIYQTNNHLFIFGDKKRWDFFLFSMCRTFMQNFSFLRFEEHADSVNQDNDHGKYYTC